ncbi:SUKH-4 family immunity protein [Streptomyces sp. enrichment culture]|uniref:SUKH-4 family immunity protein n=1 Tax=Streptomyces sp. enrichment culture TaxID=1795815 RepID=UPI003F571963
MSTPPASLVTRVRFATSLEDPRRPRGAARRTQQGCERPSLWNTSTLMSCLILTAGHRTAPAPFQDLPPRFLDRDFAPADITRFEDIDFPATLLHDPTRRFLRETGLPEDAHPFHRDQDPDDLPLPTLAEYCEELPGRPTPPARADHLIRLGRLSDGAHAVVDGTRGTILAWNARQGTLHPLMSDVSALALTLWALRRMTRLEAGAGSAPA